MLIGNKITLEAVEEKDLPPLLKWRNNADFRQYFREYRELTFDHHLKWYKDKILNDDSWQFFAVRDQASQKLIGSTGLTYIHWVYRTAELSIMIGDTDFHGGGYGADTLQTLLRYGFKNLNLNKVWCEVYDNNSAVKLYRKTGFRDEGVLRQHVFKNGHYHDALILSILKSEYEQIKSSWPTH